MARATDRKVKSAAQEHRRRFDRDRLDLGCSRIDRLLRDHEWRWSHQYRDFLDRLQAKGARGTGAQTETSRTDRDALEEAQELVYRAWDAGERRRKTLARKALELSPDCADAYVILGESARSDDEAYELYRQGVEAAERALGLDAFVRYGGRFWSVLETRPYMRAKLRLADSLWNLGKIKESIRHYEELLNLDPNDNQGVRYWYVLCLFAIDEDDLLEKLLDRYSWDATAPWTYARALWSFKMRGPSRSRRALARALDSNPHVPAFLLGQRELTGEMPDFVGIGSEEEAAAVADALVDAWDQVPGALSWLRQSLRDREPSEPNPSLGPATADGGPG